MAAPEIEAKLVEEGGACYNVLLRCAPCVGELIDLHSFVDAAAKHPPRHQYEVTKVIHQLCDVGAKRPSGRNGDHSLTVFVKRSRDKHFRE